MMTLFVAAAAAAGLDLSGFAFLRTIDTAQLTEAGVVSLQLDAHVLQFSTLSDLRVLEDGSHELPLRLILPELENVAAPATVVGVSSTAPAIAGQSFEAARMLTRSPDAWRPDPSEVGEHWVRLDLGSDVTIRRLQLTETSGFTHREAEVRAGQTQESLRVVLTRRTLGAAVDLPDVTARFIELHLWSESGLAIETIEAWAMRPTHGTILVPLKPNVPATLYYGHPTAGAAVAATFELRDETPVLALGPVTDNPTYRLPVPVEQAPPPDRDADGIPDAQDNCLKIANVDQRDTDGDRIGDVCDTCSTVRNPTQDDADRDGLGNACDSTDDRFGEKYPWLLWGAFTFVALVTGTLALRLTRRPPAQGDA